MKYALTTLFNSIQNVQIVKKVFLLNINNKNSKLFLDFLWDKGFLKGYTKAVKRNIIFLRYKKDQTIFQYFNSILKNSYNFLSVKQLWKIQFMKSLFIFSTSLGLNSQIECKKMKICGKVCLALV